MIRPDLRTLLLSALLVTACHRADMAAPSHANGEPPGPSTTATAAPDAIRSDGPQAPAVAHFVLLEQTSSRLRLRAEVRKQAPLSVPVTVRTQVPQGLQLVAGPAVWEVPAEAGPGLYTQEMTFHIDAPSSEPVRLTAHAEGAGFGVHATDTFRLANAGQSLAHEADPQTPSPQPTGPTIKVGDRDFGNAVPKK